MDTTPALEQCPDFGEQDLAEELKKLDVEDRLAQVEKTVFSEEFKKQLIEDRVTLLEKYIEFVRVQFMGLRTENEKYQTAISNFAADQRRCFLKLNDILFSTWLTKHGPTFLQKMKTELPDGSLLLSLCHRIHELEQKMEITPPQKDVDVATADAKHFYRMLMHTDSSKVGILPIPSEQEYIANYLKKYHPDLSK